VCKCPGCFIAKHFSAEFSPVEPEELLVRFPSSEDAEKHQCTILKCLLHHCAQLGLACKTYDIDHSNNNTSDQDPQELDCHIVVINKGMRWKVDYGRLLPTTDFHHDPSLPALKVLFALLEDDEDLFQVDIQNCYAIAEGAK
jgi:hypothetical protein